MLASFGQSVDGRGRVNTVDTIAVLDDSADLVENSALSLENSNHSCYSHPELKENDREATPTTVNLDSSSLTVLINSMLPYLDSPSVESSIYNPAVNINSAERAAKHNSSVHGWRISTKTNTYPYKTDLNGYLHQPSPLIGNRFIKSNGCRINCEIGLKQTKEPSEVRTVADVLSTPVGPFWEFMESNPNALQHVLCPVPDMTEQTPHQVPRHNSSLLHTRGPTVTSELKPRSNIFSKFLPTELKRYLKEFYTLINPRNGEEFMTETQQHKLRNEHADERTYVPKDQQSAVHITAPYSIGTQAGGNFDARFWWDPRCVTEFLMATNHRKTYLDQQQTKTCCPPLVGYGPGGNVYFPSDLRKPKRIRTAFSPQQLFQLESTFERNHYVVGQERKDLASNLGLTETQVKVWFQNRRTKYKRLRLDDKDEGVDSPYEMDDTSLSPRTTSAVQSDEDVNVSVVSCEPRLQNRCKSHKATAGCEQSQRREGGQAFSTRCLTSAHDLTIQALTGISDLCCKPDGVCQTTKYFTSPTVSKSETNNVEQQRVDASPSEANFLVRK
ncbi:hypothetical protein PHET_01138 [Paragonimus heterotremus]|uniref:Homeobox domain-containing protein n=1 Tax=Paragonimus heterotremus TaxID=100268 RepID=A0A8J4X391_9TREM|nr:hypothetical protein PHET_01138 [Paragonimus heterotremus]